MTDWRNLQGGAVVHLGGHGSDRAAGSARHGNDKAPGRLAGGDGGFLGYSDQAVLSGARGSSFSALTAFLPACRDDGTALDPARVSRHFGLVLRRAGLPRARLHDLRHCHAAMLMAAGISPKLEMERLGHSSTTFTLDVYSHVQPAMRDEVIRALDALLSPQAIHAAGDSAPGCHTDVKRMSKGCQTAKTAPLKSAKASRAKPRRPSCCNGAGGRTRTGTSSRTLDFEPSASAIPPHRRDERSNIIASCPDLDKALEGPESTKPGRGKDSELGIGK